MTGLETIAGWLYAHTFTLVYGAVVAIVLVSVFLWTGVSKLMQPFLDELRMTAAAFKEIISTKAISEFQVFLGLAAIAFALFGGLVVLAVLSLIGDLSTPHG